MGSAVVTLDAFNAVDLVIERSIVLDLLCQSFLRGDRGRFGAQFALLLGRQARRT